MNIKNEIKKYNGYKNIVQEIVEEIVKYKDNKNDDDVNLSHLWIKLNDILIEQNKEIIKNLKRKQKK